MKNEDDFILGILGGMGPMAGVEFQKRIIEKVPARKDDDHIKMICFTNPKIKDRTSSIKNGEDFSREIIKSLGLMSSFNISLGVITCNTAHSSFNEIASKIEFPLINMIQETVDFVLEKFNFIGSIGLLATDGTIENKLYEKALNNKDIKVLIPKKESQKEVMNVIYGKSGIKSGCINSNRVKIIKIIKELEEDGADLIILGCTELSLLGIEGRLIIDPLDAVADKVLKIKTARLFQI